MKVRGLLFLFVCLLSQPGQSKNLKLAEITGLSAYEVYDAQVFHDGALFVTRMLDKKDELNSSVEIYDANGKLLQSIALPFSPRHISPYRTDSVLITGARSWPWRTYIAEISRTTRGWKSSVQQFPERIQVEHLAAGPAGVFLQLLGDNAIMKWTGWNNPRVGGEIHGPWEMRLAGDALYVIESNNISDPTDDNLVRVDPKTGTADRTFKDFFRVGLRNLEYLKNAKLLAVAEHGLGNVILVDPRSNKVKHIHPVPPGEPSGLGELGHCLVVSSYMSRQVTFWDLRTSKPELVDQWDLSPLGNRFKSAGRLSVNSNTGQIYLRSTYICSSCVDTMSSAVLAEDLDRDAFKACLADS